MAGMTGAQFGYGSLIAQGVSNTVSLYRSHLGRSENH